MNAAAVWQVASVVVAQKHLADISAKLDQIVKGIDKLSEFLDTERRSNITGTYSYLKQVADAIQGGEISTAARAQLEGCERDLLSIQDYLIAEAGSTLQEEIKHSETFGTESLAEDLRKRFDALTSLADDLRLCIKTRILAWHIMSLVPGEAQIKLAREKDIIRGIAELSNLESALEATLNHDLTKIRSRLNRASTIEQRKAAIRTSAQSARASLKLTRDDCRDSVTTSATMLLTHDQPITLFALVENGELISVHEP